MRNFLDEDFLLYSDTAKRLYHDHAKSMPIFDYHCHLPPKEIADNYSFPDVAEAWLGGDHYKWRAMRANGVTEDLITGSAAPRQKFQAWAETVPYTIGNPLYQWTHLEMQRYFDISNVLLDASTAETVWKQANEKLARPALSTRGILKKFNVRVVCTTDDPADSLEYHKQIAADGNFNVKILPAFRPDKALAFDQPKAVNTYLDKLSLVSDIEIKSWRSYGEALRSRIEYFHAMGSRLSDHALIVPVAEPHTDAEVEKLFARVRSGKEVTSEDVRKLRTAGLLLLGREYNRRGWTMQFHLGALRNTNSRFFPKLGPDTGFDSMNDEPMAAPLARFLDMLDRENQLPRIILYILNPSDNDMIASMIGNFQDGSVPGKIQFGSGWWYNDQKNGMERQMTALANTGLLSRFVGMLTDSRSFLSYPRHEYFRRVLCNMIGEWVERGEAPGDIGLLSRTVKGICFDNAAKYFGIEVGT